MFGIGMQEVLLILVIALIVIGPKKLPDLAKSLGRAYGEFKRATAEIKESLDIDDELQDMSKAFHSAGDDIKASIEGAEELENKVQSMSSSPEGENEKNDPAEPEPIESRLADKNIEASDSEVNSGTADVERK